MTRSRSHQDRGQPLLPWPVLMLLVLCIIPEVILQLADRSLPGAPGLRGIAYAFGAFQPDILSDYGLIFSGQPLLMFATYGFLHIGLMHLTINMIGLVWLGRLTLERRVPETFLTLYFLSMIGAAEVFSLIGPASGTMVGASGALFGLLGAHLVDSGVLPTTTSSPRLTPQIARVLLVTLALILADILSSVMLGSPVAWQAHAGGFLTGALTAQVSPPRSRKTVDTP